MADDEGWRQLGRRIRLERSRRWPRRPDFARAAGLSDRVVGEVERAERPNFSPDTLAGIEYALGWAPGSCDLIRAGRQPRRVEDPEFTRIRDAWPRLSPDARRMLAAVAEHAAGRITGAE